MSDSPETKQDTNEEIRREIVRQDAEVIRMSGEMWRYLAAHKLVIGRPSNGQ